VAGATALKDCKTLESMVTKQAAEGRLYAAICAAPAVALGSWGLLKGKKVRIITALDYQNCIRHRFHPPCVM
jgi:putative intracellular protease/amidase